MLPKLQDAHIDINLGKVIKNIFLLQDRISSESDTMAIEDDSQCYQLFFDENILFLHETNMDMESYIDDMDKKVIFQLVHNSDLDIRLKYDGKFLLLQSLDYNIKFKILNDVFLYPRIEINKK